MAGDKKSGGVSGDLSGLGSDGKSSSPRLLEKPSIQSQTLQVGSLFGMDLTSTGSFDIRGIQKTTLGKLLDALPTPVLILDQSNLIFFSNKFFTRIAGDSGALWLRPFSEVFPQPRDAEIARAGLDRVSKDRLPQIVEGYIGSKTKAIWGRMHMRALRLREERFILVLVEDLTAEKKRAHLAKNYAESLRAARDRLELQVQERMSELVKANEDLKHEIAVRKSAEEKLLLAANVIASSNEAIVITNSESRILDVNTAFSEMTGYSKEEVIGKNPGVMASGRHERAFWIDFWRTIEATGQWRGEVWDRRKNGEVFPKLLSVSAIRGNEGTVTHYVGMFSDISHIKQSEERLEHLAHYDPLTELPNRLLFKDRLSRSIISARRAEGQVALMFLDLDDFKSINDTFGHPIGDEVLVGVAQRLNQCVRQADTLARLGGDEFTILLPDADDPAHVAGVARRIIESFSKPISLDGKEVFTSASIGISIYPKDGEDGDKLLQNADTAMYSAKERGRNGFQFFSREMNEEVTRFVEMELALRQAIQDERLFVYYQPSVDCRNGRIVGMEALLRLQHTTGEIVSAGPYIPVAEDKGLIISIGESVLRTACSQSRSWQLAGCRPLLLSVNLSMRQLRNPDAVASLRKVVDETGYDCRYLELELTESEMMASHRTAIEVLNRFREMGVSISIDDFGTGYSSLSYLRQVPANKIKIDQSFVQGIAHDSRQRALVQAMVTVAHSLDMKAVAEGVETKEQWDALCDLDCDALQGYYFSPAVSPSEFARLISSQTV